MELDNVGLWEIEEEQGLVTSMTPVEERRKSKNVTQSNKKESKKDSGAVSVADGYAPPLATSYFNCEDPNSDLVWEGTACSYCYCSSNSAGIRCPGGCPAEDVCGPGCYNVD